jgi:hypothetical protein
MKHTPTNRLVVFIRAFLVFFLALACAAIFTGS